MNNDAFKELISTSQKEANWTRQRERKKQTMKYRVAFGDVELGGSGGGERSELTFIENDGEYKEEVKDEPNLSKLQGKQKKRRQSLLDYQQQYPTMLPLKEPAEEAQVGDIDDGLASFLPPEHFTRKDKNADGSTILEQM
eukprot:TRINITY_DN24348_c1_g1_i4.p2 TRINITY_DN24348_c1_g1~~TRINITY_DN24348_c1_g1_i4.p2  ORF type:complete len:140 (+),score=28.97 TRINITY_DN24348_c1_g1_i4:183-602(+)